MAPADYKKLARFGLIGALGCLLGWIVGEPFLALALPDAAAGGAPSLVSRGEAPPPSAEFDKRLRERGAKTGDVQISLIWNTVDDLDLHCLPPSPEKEIFYDRRRSDTGGLLDVDTNAGCSKNVRPDAVENIFWPEGKAPTGEYRIYVNFFTPCPEKAIPPKGGVPFKLSVLADGERKELDGTARFSAFDLTENRVLVHTFQVGPKVRIFTPKTIPATSGQTIAVPFEIQRVKATGTVTVQARDLPEGMKAEPVEVPSGQTEGVLKIECKSIQGGEKIRLFATSGELSGSSEFTIELVASSSWSWRLVLVIGIWTAFLAAGLTLALVIGQNMYLGKSPLNGAPLAAMKAAGAGFVSGALGQMLLFLFAYLGMKFLGLFFGWLLLGWLLGRGVSLFIPNLEAKKAGYAGLAGGAIGAISFIVASMVFEWLGRFGGAVMLGFCIGLMVAIVEVAFRRAWLEVKLGAREIISVNLGPEPVKIGSDAKACTVFARGAAPIALKYWIRDGVVLCSEDRAGETAVHDGDLRMAGSVEVIVHTSGTSEARPVPAAVTKPTVQPIPVPQPVPPQAQPVAVPPVAPSKPTAPPLPAKMPIPPPVPAPKPMAPPKPIVPPAPSGASTGATSTDVCPVCKRKAANRYCLVCDRKF